MKQSPFYWLTNTLFLVLSVSMLWLGRSQAAVGMQQPTPTPTRVIEPDCSIPIKQQQKPVMCGDIFEPPEESLYKRYPRYYDHTLAVYYVIPADVPFDQAVYDRVVEASLEIQAWYQVAAGGVTWQFAFPEIVRVYQAQQNRQFYVDNGNWWGSLFPEMGGEGLPVWAPGAVTAVWAHGAGWWAGGAQSCSSDCGMALLGVELFPEFNNPAFSGGVCPDPDGEGVEAWPCVPVGAYAHELGHPLGLIHPADQPDTAPVAGHSLMQTHWNYPDQAPPFEQPWGFLRNERQAIRSNLFMKSGIELIQIYQDAQIDVNLVPAGPVPVTDFEAEVYANQVELINKTQGATLHYWTFGDYRATGVVSPTHTYLKNGVYTVTLRASSDQAMMGVMSRTITIDFYIPKLALSKTGPATVVKGYPLTYTLRVSNTGTTTATNLVITDVIPAGAHYLSGGTRTGNIVNWAISSLGIGSTAQVTFAVTTTHAITNSDYRVRAAGEITATGNIPVFTQVQMCPPGGCPVPLLTLSKTGLATVVSGTPLTYTLRVSNTGTAPAIHLVITDVIPAGAHYLSGGTKVGNVVRWTINSLGLGSTAQVTFAVTTTRSITNSDYRVSAEGGYQAGGSVPVTTLISGGQAERRPICLPIVRK